MKLFHAKFCQCLLWGFIALSNASISLSYGMSGKNAPSPEEEHLSPAEISHHANVEKTSGEQIGFSTFFRDLPLEIYQKILADVLPQTQVDTLGLRYNFIYGDGIKILGDVLPQSKIKCLDVSHNLIDGLAIYTIYKFVTEVLSQTQLVKLDCSANQLLLFSKKHLPGTSLHKRKGKTY